MFIYISNFTFRSVTNGVIPVINYRLHCSWGLRWVCRYQHGTHVAFLQDLSKRLTPEVALFDSSHNPLGKKGVSLTGRMCQATAAAPPPHTHTALPRPPTQTSTHWTHQVISWGLKYLLGKYLPWLSDPTSQFKDMGLTNFSLYLTNHQDIPQPPTTPSGRTMNHL